MATSSAIAKRTEKRQVEILEAVNDLKAGFIKMAPVEGEVLEATVQVDEVQAEKLRLALYGLKQQVAEVSGQVAELKTILTAPPPAATPPSTSRRTKK